MRNCAHCNEPIGREADFCPHCRTGLSPHPARPPEPLDQEGKASRRFIAGGIALLGLWAIAWFIIPWHFSGRKEEAEQMARDSLSQIQISLESYRSARGSYPPSLGSLREPVWTALKKAKSAHYAIQYTSGPLDFSQQITSYSLQARGQPAGFVNYFTDESGIYRSTTQNRDATKADPRIQSDNAP
jgi:type II secretory pathway pseudopilin PulG